MQKIMFIINDAPYGSEKAYNALRMAMALQKEHRDQVEIRIYLLADAVFCGLLGQNTPLGFYNIERMLTSVIQKGAQVKSCCSCSEARGIAKTPMIEGIEVSSMADFSQWVLDCNKVMTF